MLPNSDEIAYCGYSVASQDHAPASGLGYAQTITNVSQCRNASTSGGEAGVIKRSAAVVLAQQAATQGSSSRLFTRP
jgi:hypothetical protein